MRKFADKILSLLRDGFNYVIEALGNVVEFIAKPFVYLFAFLEAVIYFFYMVYKIVVEVIMIFVALFQFFFAVVKGLVRTIVRWLSVKPNPGDIRFPDKSGEGVNVVFDLMQGTGFLTIVPQVALALLWLFFIIKIIGLFGGNVSIRPFGGGGE